MSPWQHGLSGLHMPTVMGIEVACQTVIDPHNGLRARAAFGLPDIYLTRYAWLRVPQPSG
jgi:hypothetical protein